MTRIATVLAACLVLASGSVAPAQTVRVVVELFTSQGCSSCPPADRMMHDLDARDDVLPLALHVDYWDYIGWKDEFARPEHTKRQKTYARIAGRHSIYTPQMIVNGKEGVVGARAMELADLIMTHKDRPVTVALTADREGDRLHIEAAAVPDAAAPMLVQLVRYIPRRTVKIRRGENAGHEFTYVNVVDDWVILREWDGREPLDLATDIEGPRPAAVLIQYAEQGEIVAAAQID